MKKLIDNVADLVKVKTIVTLVLIVVFAVLSLNGGINPEFVKEVVLVVIAFYFGTQQAKKDSIDKVGDQ